MCTSNHRNELPFLCLALWALLTGVVACERDKPSGPVALTVANASDLPPVYTTQQCADLVSQFAGWAQVASVPEYDENGLPTIFYAAVTVATPQQLADLKTVGIYVDSLPIFMDQATRAKFDGQVGYVSKSTCGGAEIVWALVPGLTFNRIAQDTVKFNETMVEGIQFLPLPAALTDTSVSYNGVHPVSPSALRAAGFNAPQAQTASAADGGAEAVAFSWNPLHYAAEAVNDLEGDAKDVVQDAVKVGDWIVTHFQEGVGWIACHTDGCVDVTVHLDVRNTDPAFGGQAVAGGSDGTTGMVRTWGSEAGQPLHLPGVLVSARQTYGSGVLSTTIRYDGSADTSGTAKVQAVRGKTTDFCLTLDNYAATLNDWFNARELCDFSKVLTSTNGGARPDTTFESNDEVNLRVEDKYVNVMAQLTDGYDYLLQIAGYTPHKAKVLSGTPLDVPGIKQLIGTRAVTPCLNFPNVAVDAVNSALDHLASALPPPFDILGFLFAGSVEAIYEDDMWLPNNGDTLIARNIASHEYGHFAMCSLLYDQDWTKMVQVPSLIVQRAAEGSYGDATDEVAYLMEGWAELFAGQIAGGTNYFALNDQLPAGPFCDGSKNDCYDWNYVEDLDSTKFSASGSYGFVHQVRRVTTTLWDAFDGHAIPSTSSTATPATQTGLSGFLGPQVANATNVATRLIAESVPSNGDFWSEQAGGALITPSLVHGGDAKDEAIALPGTALVTLIHNWTHATWPLGWRVSQQQFFSALNATIRGTASAADTSRDYNWCEACQMFSQHDGLSCTLTGNTSVGGECTSGETAMQPKMSLQQMVSVCTDSATIPGFIGAPPSAADPTSTCTFGGCPAHTILVGSVGEASSSCTACGPHQVSSGTVTCPGSVCATPTVSANTCVDCRDDQVVGGADGNTCVSCPALQIPNAARTACVACAPHQIAVGVACVACASDQIAAPDNTCQVCPAGQVPYNETLVGPPTFGVSCLPAAECTCGPDYCRAINAAGICQDTVG